jgi:hypothetical protein
MPNRMLILQKNISKMHWLVNDNAYPDVVPFCPGCKVMETLSPNGEGILQTRRLIKRAGSVYHDCDSNIPCRLFSLS